MATNRVSLSFCPMRKGDLYEAPKRMQEGDVGFDLTISRYTQVFSGQNAQLATNIAIEIPLDWFGLIVPRSSAMHYKGLLVSPAVIGSEYRGEVMIFVRNVIDRSVHIHPGERVAQLLILPVAWSTGFVERELSPGSRGDDGFGSTGGYSSLT